MKIEFGKVYENRKGDLRKIVSYLNTDRGPWCVIDNEGAEYTEEGYFQANAGSVYDLVKEVHLQ